MNGARPVRSWPVRNWPIRNWPVRNWPVRNWPVRKWTARAAQVGAVVAIAAASLISWAPVASAHTLLDSSDPADGASLVASPAVATLTYSEDIELRLTAVTVDDGTGQAAATTTSADPHRPAVLLVHLPHLGRGVYALHWRVIDSEDLHLTIGTVIFGVGTTPPAALAHPATRPPDPAEVALKVASRSGLAVLLGSLAIAFGVVPRALGRRGSYGRLRRRLLQTGATGLGVALLADTVLLVVQAGRAGPLGSTIGRLVSHDPVGHSWLVETAVGLVVAAGLLARLARRGEAGSGEASGAAGSREAGGAAGSRGAGSGAAGSRGAGSGAAGSRGAGNRPARPWRQRASEALLIAGALTIDGAVALAGHSGGAPHPTAWATGLRAAHLVAVSVWLGGLACVTLCLVWVRGQRRAADGDRDTTAWPSTAGLDLLRSYSPVAAAGMAAILVSGLALSGREVATVTALLSTWYGAILLAKVAVVGLVGVLGLRHALGLRRGLGLRPSRSRRRPGATPRPVSVRSLAVELTGGIVALALGAALSATAPALGPQYLRPAATVPPTLSAPAADLVIRTTLAPNRPGIDLADIVVLNTRRPAPGPVDGVTLTLRRPGAAPVRLETRRAGDGSWSAGEVQLVRGPMTVEVRVRRAGLPDVGTTMAWTVNDYARWTHPTVASAAAWGPIADRLAWAVLGGAGALLVGGRLLRRRRSRVSSGTGSPDGGSDGRPALVLTGTAPRTDSAGRRGSP